MRLRLNSFVNEREEQVIKKFENKKLICYGASSRYGWLNTTIYIEDLVEFFVDGNSERWGEVYCGKEIKNPEELRKIDKEKYMVVVLTGAFLEVSKVLDDMGFINGVNYINLFEMLQMRAELIKNINAANKLSDFLDTVPSEIKTMVPQHSCEKMGVVVSIEGLNFEPDFPYCITLFLILKWKKYDVKLIVDNLSWTGDIELYEGYCEDCRKIQKEVIHRLEQIVPKEDIVYIDAYGISEISEEDKQECQRIAEYSAMWQKGKNLQNIRYMSVELVEEKFAEVFLQNIGYVKAFFEKSKFDMINISTALHKRAGIIAYIGKKNGIRITSQDGTRGIMELSADGVAGHADDIPRLMKGDWITVKEEERILEAAGEMADMRFTTVASDSGVEDLQQFYKMIESKGYNCINWQMPGDSTGRIFDVIIPLNVVCDATAIGVLTPFGDVKQWLKETLDFLISKLKVSVLLRDHPCLKVDESYRQSLDMESWAPEILEPYKGNSLLYYAKFDEEMNLYQYIKQSRVVLPWTTTVGVEAALMQKNVVVHTDASYSDSAFVMRAHSKEEYFSLIKKCLSSDKWLVSDAAVGYREALMYFYYGMFRHLGTVFTNYDENYRCVNHTWLSMSFEELLRGEGVAEVVQIIADGIPSVYLNAKQREDTENII